MSLRLLACEADEDFAHALLLTARDAGHELRSTASWMDVLPLVHSWKPHILFLDVDTGDVNAADLAVEVKWMTEARVVLYGCRSLDPDALDALQSKCDRFVPKDKLFRSIRRLPCVRDTRAIRRPARPDVAGTFDERAPLCELLTSVEFNRKTGALAIQTARGEEGTLLFREGAPVSSTFAGQTGRDAVLALLGAASGRFVMKLRDVKGERSVPDSFSRLIFEHLRDRDESSADDVSDVSADDVSAA